MESEVSMTNETKSKICDAAKLVTSSKEAATDFKKSAGILKKSGNLVHI
jgi:hypothetical protein